MATRLTIAMLETLVAFGHERSMVAVAKRLGVSQPAVSANLARFEEICGFPLVSRSPSGSELTVEGREISELADDALRTLDRMNRRIQDYAAAGVHPLRIAASMTIAEYLLSDWITAVGGGFRMSDVVLAVGNSQMVTDLVERGNADVGFVEGATVDPALAHAIVGEDQLVVIASPEMAHDAGRPGLRVAELIDRPLFVREQGSGTREVFDAELARHGLSLGRLTTSLGSTSAIKAAVRSGSGMGVVSESAVQDEFAAGALMRVEVAELDLRRRLHAVWVNGSRLDSRAAMIIAAARSASGAKSMSPQREPLENTR